MEEKKSGRAVFVLDGGFYPAMFVGNPEWRDCGEDGISLVLHNVVQIMDRVSDLAMILDKPSHAYKLVKMTRPVIIPSASRVIFLVELPDDWGL